MTRSGHGLCAKFVLFLCGRSWAIVALVLVGCNGGEPISKGRMDATTPNSEDAGVTSADSGGGDVPSCEMEFLEINHEPFARERTVEVESKGDTFRVVYTKTHESVESLYESIVLPDADHETRRLLSGNGVVRALQIHEGFIVWEDIGQLEISRRIRGVRVEQPDILFELSGQDQNAQSPAIVRTSEGWLIGYSEEEEEWYQRVRIWRSDHLGAAVELSHSESPSALTLGRGTQDGALPFAVWIADGFVRLQRLSPRGQPIGDVQVLNTEGNARGRPQMSLHENGGLVVFEVDIRGRREIRSRLIDENGMPKSREQVVLVPPFQGRAMRVTTYQGGFAVIYRVQDGINGAWIRLAFVHGSGGEVVLEQDIEFDSVDDVSHRSEVSPGISVVEDGTLMVSWASAEPTGTAIRGVRLHCPSAWLRCSPRTGTK